MIDTFDISNFKSYCDELGERDADIKQILLQSGYPPMWSRDPGFETLIHIILEQQVSLASAKAALNKLKDKIGKITPLALLALSDSELRECYFSRQKTVYARALAEAIQSGRLNLRKLNKSNDEIIRAELKKIKGIGDWTVDVYLLMGLQRRDIFPVGDLAMINSFRKMKKLPHDFEKERLVRMAESWRPHRSIAAMILWHQYIIDRKIKL